MKRSGKVVYRLAYPAPQTNLTVARLPQWKPGPFTDTSVSQNTSFPHVQTKDDTKSKRNHDRSGRLFSDIDFKLADFVFSVLPSGLNGLSNLIARRTRGRS